MFRGYSLSEHVFPLICFAFTTNVRDTGYVGDKALCFSYISYS